MPQVRQGRSTTLTESLHAGFERLEQCFTELVDDIVNVLAFGNKAGATTGIARPLREVR